MNIPASPMIMTSPPGRSAPKAVVEEAVQMFSNRRAVVPPRVQRATAAMFATAEPSRRQVK